MIRTLKTVALAGALAMLAVPASAAILTLPFIGDIEHPDFDPLHIVTPEAPAAAPAPEKPKAMHHKMKKKMMKKKMKMKKKM